MGVPRSVPVPVVEYDKAPVHFVLPHHYDGPASSRPDVRIGGYRDVEAGVVVTFRALNQGLSDEAFFTERPNRRLRRSGGRQRLRPPAAS